MAGDQTNTGNAECYACNQEIRTLDTQQIQEMLNVMHATKKYALWRPNKYRKCRMLCMQPRNIHFGDQTNTGNTEFYAHNQEICTLETNKHMKYIILCTQPRNTKSK